MKPLFNVLLCTYKRNIMFSGEKVQEISAQHFYAHKLKFVTPSSSQNPYLFKVVAFICRQGCGIRGGNEAEACQTLSRHRNRTTWPQTKLACFPAWVDIPGTCGFDLGPVRIRLLPIVREKNAGKGAKINKDYIHNLIILRHTVAHSSLKTDSKK